MLGSPAAENEPCYILKSNFFLILKRIILYREQAHPWPFIHAKRPLLSQKEVIIYTEFEARNMQNQMRTLTLLNIMHLIVGLQLIHEVSVAIIGSVNSSVIFIKVHYFFLNVCTL